MKFQHAIECLERYRVKYEDDIRWYQQGNRMSADMSDEDRQEHIAELTVKRDEVVLAIQRIREGKLDRRVSEKPVFFRYFIVLNQKWEVLLRGQINEDRSITITYRYNAPERNVSERYSDFEVVFHMIPVGTLPTIQFAEDAATLKEFL